MIWKEKRIVVAEDDVEEQGLLSAIICQFDRLIKIDLVTNGLQLLNYLSRCQIARLPFLIILDLHMPVLNGLEVLDRMRAENVAPNVPVVVLSSFIDSDTARKCLNSGAALCLPKPEKPSELKRLARRILEFCQ